MAFQVSGEVYDRFMGRYSVPLALVFADFAGIAHQGDLRALDVGCGPGALTAELVRRLGADRVAAVDPSPQFVAACLERLPNVDVRRAPAEQLPWKHDSFDAGLAQLVLSFVQDGPAAARELRRVVRPGGVVAACMWGTEGGMEMLKVFWQAARELAPSALDEARMPYRTVPELRALWEEAGLEEIETGPLDVIVGYQDFDDFWAPFLGGVGPAGSYVASLDEEHRVALRDQLRRGLNDPVGAFRLSARAWAVRGVVPDA
jgi:SAM-dependent methyltransferase